MSAIANRYPAARKKMPAMAVTPLGRGIQFSDWPSIASQARKSETATDFTRIQEFSVHIIRANPQKSVALIFSLP